MARSLSAALVGLGNVAWKFDWSKNDLSTPLTHAGIYKKIEEVELVAAFSPDDGERVLAEKALGIPCFPSLESMLEHTRPDIVSICSPTQFHFEQVKTCIERAVPMIWLEKPPCASLTEQRALLDYFEELRSPSKIQVNYMRRYMPNYLRLKDAMKEAKGGVKAILISYSRGIWPNGSHLIDLISFLMDDHFTYEIRWAGGGDPENPSSVLTLNGTIDVFILGLNLPYHCIDIGVIFEDKRISILHGGLTSTQESVREHEWFPGFFRLVPEETFYTSKEDLSKAMELGLLDLIHAHETGGETASSLKTSLMATKIITEITKWPGP